MSSPNENEDFGANAKAETKNIPFLFIITTDFQGMALGGCRVTAGTLHLPFLLRKRMMSWTVRKARWAIPLSLRV